MTDKENTAYRLEQVKKPYRAPDLHEYGSIQEITWGRSRQPVPNDTGVGKGNDRTGL
jgi:hypothetical protein